MNNIELIEQKQNEPTEQQQLEYEKAEQQHRQNTLSTCYKYFPKVLWSDKGEGSRTLEGKFDPALEPNLSQAVITVNTDGSRPVVELSVGKERLIKLEEMTLDNSVSGLKQWVEAKVSSTLLQNTLDPEAKQFLNACQKISPDKPLDINGANYTVYYRTVANQAVVGIYRATHDPKNDKPIYSLSQNTKTNRLHVHHSNDFSPVDLTCLRKSIPGMTSLMNQQVELGVSIVQKKDEGR